MPYITTQQVFGFNTAGTSTIFMPAANTNADGIESTTEVNAQITYSTNVSIIQAYAGIGSSTSTIPIDFTLRVNGVDSALAVTIGVGASGAIAGNANEVSVSATDLANFRLTRGGTESMALLGYQFWLKHSNPFMKYGMYGSVSYGNANTTRFWGLSVNDVLLTVEADAQHEMLYSATFCGFSIYISSNGRASTTTARFRKNGANGNQNLTIGAGLTGFFTDTTNTDTVVNGDDVCMSVTHGSGSGNAAYRSVTVECLSDTNEVTYIAGDADGVIHSTASAIRYSAITGGISWNGGTANTRTIMGHSGSIRDVRITIFSNTRTTNTTVELYKNGAATGISWTVAGGSVSPLSSTGNNVTFVAGDFFNIAATNGTGAGSFGLSKIAVNALLDSTFTPYIIVA